MSSLPGLTRQSIHLCENLLAKKMDARVKPAHDWLQKSLRPGAVAGVSIAGLIHRREFAAAEIHHAWGQPAAPRDPAAHVLRVDVHQQLRRLAARHLLAIAAGMPGRMEAEPRARRDADAVGRDHAEQPGARRTAGAVDDGPLARPAQRPQFFEVRADLAPGIRFDSDRRMRT